MTIKSIIYGVIDLKNSSSDITQEKFRLVTLEMGARKVLGPEGLAIEFFIQFWSIVGADYHKMVVEVITTNKFTKGITKRLIILLNKGGA
jgi:hypothetical protein